MVFLRNASHPDPVSDSPSEILLPAHFFFSKVLDLPPGLEEKELPSFVEITIEELSPFPLNQLFYGSYRPGTSRRLLVFAAYRKRFTAGQTEQWQRAHWVAPEFISVLGGESAQPRVLILVGSDSLTGLHFDGKDAVPTQVVTRHIGTEADLEKLENEKNIILKRLGAGAASLPPQYILHQPRVSTRHQGKVLFVHEPSPGENPPPGEFSLSRQVIAAADVRDKAFLKEKAAADRKDSVAWRTFASLSVLLVLLIIGEAGLFAFNSRLANQQNLAEEQASVVAKIEEQADLALKLEELSESQLLPFEMLALLNQLRPRSVHFTRTQTVELNGLQVEATTNNTSDVNNYETALRNSGKLDKVEIQNQNLRDGRTTFTLAVTFQTGALRELASSSPPAQSGSAPVPPLSIPGIEMEARLSPTETPGR